MYLIAGTTITQVTVNFLQGIPAGASFYLNTPVVTGPNNPHPDRLGISFQIRDSTSPLTAHDLWCIYSDDKGVTWKSFNGTAMTLPMTPSNISAAFAASIPIGTPSYDPIQAMAADDTDGSFIPVEYHSTGTLAQLFAHRCKPDGTVVTAQISNWQVSDNYDFISRPTAVSRQGQIIAFFGARTTTDNIGKITAIVASGAAFQDTYQQSVVFLNGWNNSKQSSVPFDYRAWQQSGRLLLLHIRCSINGTTPPNGPFLLDTTISTAGPPAVETPLQIMGSLVCWFKGPTLVPGTWPDQSGNGRDRTQPTGSRQPTLTANQINGKPCVTFAAASSQCMQMTYAGPAPGTTPCFTFRIWRLNTWTLNRIMSTGGPLGGLIENPASPTIRLNNGVANLGVNTTLAAFRVMMTYTSNSAADFHQIGEVRATGVNTGNSNTGTVFTGAANISGTTPANMDAAEDWTCAAPTFDQIGRMIRYAISEYGPTIMG